MRLVFDYEYSLHQVSVPFVACGCLGAAHRIINGEAKKLTRLIENILDFSRMEAGLRPYRMEPADVSEAVNRVLARMETQFSQGNFEVKTSIEPDLPRILADEGAAEQAIENLLANAMKYSGDSKTTRLLPRARS